MNTDAKQDNMILTIKDSTLLESRTFEAKISAGVNPDVEIKMAVSAIEGGLWKIQSAGFDADSGLMRIKAERTWKLELAQTETKVDLPSPQA